MTAWADIDFFKPAEFDSPDDPGSGARRMNLDFVARLDELREACGFPIYITSGFRTPQHNLAVGGERNSAHLRGLAADIRIMSDHQRFVIRREAIRLGFCRLGTASTFMHIDCDTTLSQNVEWVYPTRRT